VNAIKQVELNAAAEKGTPNAAGLFELALEFAPCGMMTVDAHSRIALVNAQAEKMFGYPRGELVGRSMSILIPERMREKHRLSQKRYFEQPVSRPMGMGRELYGLRRDGSEFPIEVGINVLKTAKGNFALSVIVDISERRRLEAALLQSQKMEAMGQLASGVAHDFNNLLCHLLNCLCLLDVGQIASDARKRIIEGGKRTVNRGVALTTRLLAFSRQAPMATEASDLNCLIEELLDLLTQTLGTGGRIVTNLSSELWLTSIDRQQIEIALLNLILNARDAMVALGGTITIETENEVVSSALDGISAGNYVVLKIIDTGCGISPEALSRVVEPFYTTKAPGKGTGLGLSMVHGVARQLGGGLRIASTVNVGTTVSLYLPRCDD
jgi:PAS domain S-box-containing protein